MARALSLVLFLAAGLLLSVHAAFGQEPMLLIGYSAGELYDHEMGSLNFMPSESLWVESPLGGRIFLYYPSGSLSTIAVLQPGVPHRLYTFGDGDTGQWEVRLTAGSRSWSSTLTVLPSQLDEVSLLSPSFALGDRRLSINTGIQFAPGVFHEGGLIQLLRMESEPQRFTRTFYSELLSTYFDVGVLSNPQKILLDVTAFGAESEFEAVVIQFPLQATGWAELSLDTPFVKHVGTSTLVVSTPRVAIRTKPSRVDLSGKGKSNIDLILPPFHRVGDGGAVPLRPGRALITLMLRAGSIVQTISLPIVLSQAMYGRSVEMVTFNPTVTQLSTSFTDDLPGATRYVLVAVAKFQGSDRVARFTIDPPLAQIRLINRYTGSSVRNFVIDFNGALNVSQGTDGNTYVLLPAGGLPARYTVSVGEVVLDDFDVLPNPLTLKVGSNDIGARLGSLAIKVEDEKGVPVNGATLTITRILPTGLKQAYSNRVASSSELLLPDGEYLVKAALEDISQTMRLTVDRPAKRVTLVLQGALQERLTPPQVLTLVLGGAGLAVEAYIAYVIWSSASRRLARLQ